MDPDRFNSVILGRGPYWYRQREACRSYMAYRETCLRTGNGIGKTYLLAGLAHHAFQSNPGCKVILSAPTLGQMEGAVWGEIEAAYNSASLNGFPLGGKLRRLAMEQDANWRMEVFGSGSVESKSGRHAAKLFAFIDEASGTPPAVDEAISSLNPSTIVRMGNPLRPEGKFYESCMLSGDNPFVNVIKISSLESPHSHLDRSPHGMADKTFLESSRLEYGEDSIWWQCHILAEFPNTISEGLLPIPWLELAAQVIHVESGDTWLGIDLGLGNGGDETCLVVRDDNGIIAHRASNRWSLENAAEQARQLADEFGVHPSHIVYDANGIGADFDNRLRAEGLAGCKGFMGSLSGGDKFYNLRAAVAWSARRRLDPQRPIAHKPPGAHRRLWIPQKPFALPADLLKRYRAELQGIRYTLSGGGEITLETKEEFMKRLKKSPNFLDAWFMTYAYPNA